MPLNRAANYVLTLPRSFKRVVVLLIDASLCALSLWAAYYLVTGKLSLLEDGQWRLLWLSWAIALPCFVASGLYRAVFRYVGLAALTTVGRATMLYGILYAFVISAIDLPNIPPTIGILQPILLLMGVGGVRVLARQWLGGLDQHSQRGSLSHGMLIYGAGSAGRQLAAALTSSQEIAVLGFVDDNVTLQGSTLNGLPIYSPQNLPEIVRSFGITDLLLAIPSVSRMRRNEILKDLQRLSIRTRTLPGLIDLVHGRVQASDIHELDIEDLLGRDPVAPNEILLKKNIHHKVVLVTGAGGSIGSELCRHIVDAKPSILLLVELSEFALYEIYQELLRRLEAEAVTAVKLVPLLASVCDYTRMKEIMSAWQPKTVYHAAAYKHVPLVEQNCVEGLKNNALGTLTMARLARDVGVDDFVLISTDKAVRPTSVMGASKRLAELILQALADEEGGPRFSMVRFGNVLGSSGSVVPLFRNQIKAGGPVTLTHADMTRFFMTISEAAQLVVQAGAMAQSGDLFVLDMGPPVKIIDLARRMIDLSGLSIRDESNPDGDIEIKITGLRPGEKLYEELLTGDNPQPTQHPRIMRVREDFLPWQSLEPRFEALSNALNANDVHVSHKLLQELVMDYHPRGGVADWIYVKNHARRQLGS